MQKKIPALIWLSAFLIASFLLVHFVQAAPHAEPPTPLVPTGDIIGQLPGNMRALAVQGDYAYVGIETELVIIDMSDKTAPTEVSRL